MSENKTLKYKNLVHKLKECQHHHYILDDDMIGEAADAIEDLLFALLATRKAADILNSVLEDLNASKSRKQNCRELQRIVDEAYREGKQDGRYTYSTTNPITITPTWKDTTTPITPTWGEVTCDANGTVGRIGNDGEIQRTN